MDILPEYIVVWQAQNWLCPPLCKGNDMTLVTIKGKKQAIPPCNDRHCPLHWRRYSARMLLKVISAVPTGQHYYCFTIPMPHGAINYNAGRHLEDIFKVIRPKKGMFRYFWVRHNDNWQENYHGFIVSGLKIDTKAAEAAIWSVMSRKEGNRVSSQECYFERLKTHPGRYTAYLLGISRNKPRQNPPWEGLKGKVTQTSMGFYKPV
jgi:hypothetical protein